jgi:phosphoribosylamine---glycine ligase
VKILLLDHCGAALDWAMMCQDWGHEVRMWMALTKENKRNKVGDGIVPKVQEWKSSMKWADLVFLTDNISCLKELEPYRKAGYPIFGPSYEAAKLELDREMGQEAFKKAGIKVMDSTEFDNYDDAIKHVLKTMDRYVSKPSGDADKALSYVSKSPADMIFMLQRWKQMGKNKAPFILQKFNPGIEMAVGGWFGPAGWSKWFCENFEHKKLMAGDNGQNTGEMGTCLRYVKDSKLAEEMLKPLTSMLHKIGYTGYLDVAVIIDGDGKPWPLEFTCRPGWPCFVIQTALHNGDPAEWMLDLLQGRDTLQVNDEIATGVVVAIPDFPYGNKPKEEVTGFPIYGVDHMLTEDIKLCEVMRGVAPLEVDGKITNAEMYVTAGDYVLVAAGTDYTVEGSAKRAYRAIKKAEIPNSPMWRIDIGKRLKEQLPALQDHNYATSWKYE